jgi:hypothetical protein
MTELKPIAQELASVLHMLRTGIDIAYNNGQNIRFTRKTLDRIDAILVQYNDYLIDKETK